MIEQQFKTLIETNCPNIQLVRLAGARDTIDNSMPVPNVNISLMGTRPLDTHSTALNYSSYYIENKIAVYTATKYPDKQLMDTLTELRTGILGKEVDGYPINYGGGNMVSINMDIALWLEVYTVQQLIRNTGG